MTIRYRYSGAGLQGFARFDGSFSNDVLRGLYRSILRIRRIGDESADNEQAKPGTAAENRRGALAESNDSRRATLASDDRPPP